MNSEIHGINTRRNSDFHQPLSHLTIIKKVLCMWVLRYITTFHLK